MEEAEAIQYLEVLLKPFHVITVLMSGSTCSFPTMSVPIAIIKGLLGACAPVNGDAELQAQLREQLNTSIGKYFYNADELKQSVTGPRISILFITTRLLRREDNISKTN